MRTIVTDDRRRVMIPDAKPRQVYAYENRGGTVTLTPVASQEPAAAKVRFEKRHGRTVAFTDRPISLDAIKEALADFDETLRFDPFFATAFYGRSKRCKECTKERQHNAYWKAKDERESRA